MRRNPAPHPPVDRGTLRRLAPGVARYRRLGLLLVAIAGLLTASQQVSLGQPRKAGHKIKEQKQHLKEVVEKEGSILEAMDEIDRAVQEQEQQLEALRLKQQEVERRAAELEKERRALEQELASRRLYLQRRLRALYKYSTKGFLQAMLGGGTGTERLKRIRYLHQIVRRDMELLDRQRAALERLAEVRKAIEVEQLQVEELTRQVERQVAAAQQERQRKQQLLAQIRAEKTMTRRMIAELQLAASALERQVARLPEARNQPPRKTAEQSAPGQPKPQAGAARGFSAHRGRLPFPVKGAKVTRTFGRYRVPGMKTYDFHRGVDITAPAGVPFRAIYDGTVKLAKWFKGYGLLMIIDHGGGYHSIYAHASRLTRKAGDRVKTGDVIGMVGDTGSFQGPYLYLEIRKDGKPIDPLEWIRVPPDAMALP